MAGDQSKSDSGSDPHSNGQSWFQTRVRYEGAGQAEFQDPHGYVAGPTYAEFDDTGVAHASMTVERYGADEPLPLGLFQLFQHDRPVQDGTSHTLGIGLDSRANECMKLVVRTSSGIFIARAPIGYSHRHRWSLTEPEQWTLTFHLFNGQYAESSDRPAFWVLPLTNFLSRMRPADPALAQHPLRLRRAPPVPEEGSEQERLIARLNADAQNQLITFEWGNHPAHIEQLLDYDDRMHRLQNGRDQRITTAVAIGNLPASVRNEEDVERLLPQDFLSLLSLATGTEVGAPWIELRDERGQFLVRLHSHRGRPQFARGHRAIDQIIHAGIGTLLTEGGRSAIFDSPTLRVTLKHVVRSALRNLTVEDSFSYLCRAIDGLCKAQGINMRIDATTRLPDAEALRLKRIIREAAKEVRQLAKTVDASEDAELAAIVARVADRISNAKTVEQGFGKNVVQLMQQFGLADVEIVNYYLRENPRSDIRDFAAMVSNCRGIVMHAGYLDIGSDPTKGQDIVTLSEHLHDVLVRIMLRLLGYTGTYQPIVTKIPVQEGVDWVSAETPPRRLGYE
jgi:hypothetical protein